MQRLLKLLLRIKRALRRKIASFASTDERNTVKFVLPRDLSVRISSYHWQPTKAESRNRFATICPSRSLKDKCSTNSLPRCVHDSAIHHLFLLHVPTVVVHHQSLFFLSRLHINYGQPRLFYPDVIVSSGAKSALAPLPGLLTVKEQSNRYVRPYGRSKIHLSFPRSLA
jgi:hypothetical protein